jgi:hypothetical protein
MQETPNFPLLVEHSCLFFDEPDQNHLVVKIQVFTFFHVEMISANLIFGARFFRAHWLTPLVPSRSPLRP